MEFENLKLSNQICFPVYAASRLIIREYQPYLDELGITYPQYLVLMLLWETDNIQVNEITQRLILNTNTITPLLKRMEAQDLILRQRSEQDERKVFIKLTEKGKALKFEAVKIPEKLTKSLLNSTISIEQLIILKEQLNNIIDFLRGNSNNKNESL
jgi:DNA-binding MarR family transcriptional regulator